jgi:hypothetical protein
MQNNQPLDKGRLVAVVDQYQARENGQALVNQDGSPKMKNKYMAIGEATKWPDDQGGDYTTIKQFLNPPALPCETRIFWDSQDQQKTQGGGQQQQQHSQHPQQSQQQPYQQRGGR